MSNVVQLEEMTLGNGMTYNVRTCGLDNRGDLVLLVHGFPETSYMWRELMPVLADKGFRCLAPDQRGYSPKARPKGVEPYACNYLADDIAAFATLLGVERFHLVSHDWGSSVAWHVVAMYPERVISTSQMSTHYPAEYADIWRENKNQRAMGQYIFDFLKPESTELLHKPGPDHVSNKYWYDMPKEQQDVYMEVFGDIEGCEATINWYRNKYQWLIMDDPKEEDIFKAKFGDVTLPVLFIRGLGDCFTGEAAYLSMHKYMKGYYKYAQIEGGHWLMENNGEECISLITQHIEKFAVEK